MDTRERPSFSDVRELKNNFDDNDSQDRGDDNHDKEEEKPTPGFLTREDGFEAPVLWLKKIFSIPKEELIATTEKAFVDAGMEGVKVVELYTTTNRTKDHAYMLLNSNHASKLLLDGTVSVIVNADFEKDKNKDTAENHEESGSDEEGGGDEDNGKKNEISLWFDKADHLEPRENQDPFTLYIWQLPDNRPAAQIAVEIRNKIGKWCPIIDIDVPADRTGRGFCAGYAKVHTEYEFDTQKCVYLLNFSFFLGREIRAGFCNVDRVYVKKPPRIPRSTESTNEEGARPPKTFPPEKTRQSNPRPNNSGKQPYPEKQKDKVETSQKEAKPRKPRVKKESPPPDKKGWRVV